MAHANEELVRRGYDAFSRGDMNALRDEVFADDVTFHIPGQNRIAGNHVGKKSVLDFLGKVMELSGGSFRLEVHDLLGSGEHAVGLTTHTGQRAGRTANYHSVHVWHVRDGKISELWEHPEQDKFDEFWS